MCCRRVAVALSSLKSGSSGVGAGVAGALSPITPAEAPAKEAGEGKGEDTVAALPSEPTLIADHPELELKWVWIQDEKKRSSRHVPLRPGGGGGEADKAGGVAALFPAITNVSRKSSRRLCEL